MLILAGISIAMLTGDNGILSKATTAKEQTSQATAEEKVKIAVAGSYDTSGSINIDELNSNLENIEGIDKSGLPVTELPAIVVVDGYTFLIEQNGKVELSEPRPVVGNLTVTLEDGSQIPEDGVNVGTKLKIEFTATIEGGTIEIISPQVPYITNGEEKEVRFTITGKIEGVSYSTEKIINLEEFYKKTEFYGAIVDNYEVNASAPDVIKNEVTTWRIFYIGKEPNGTEENIYLIADDYINGIAAPKSQGASEITGTGYQLVFRDIINDYSGGKFIWENSLAKNWLSQYLNYTTDGGVTYPNRENTNSNIRAVAYMMDTNVWSVYAGEKAKYAIGGPTIEMFVKSYRNTHADSNIDCFIYNANGYNCSGSNELASDYNKIYRKPELEKTYGMWLASPSYLDPNWIVYSYCGGFLNETTYNTTFNGGYPGLCPLVCLKSGVQLEKKSDGVYSIK